MLPASHNISMPPFTSLPIPGNVAPSLDDNTSNVGPSLDDNSIKICGADENICPHCHQAYVNWSKINSSCVKIDAITITHKSCTTRFIPFEAHANVCVGGSSSQLTELPVRKQTFCSDGIINDDRIFIEINGSSIRTAVQGSNLLSIAIQTETFACKPSLFSMSNGELSKVCIYDVRNPAYIQQY
jgi:hypothetical protein